jgi:hypothetical protein
VLVIDSAEKPVEKLTDTQRQNSKRKVNAQHEGHDRKVVSCFRVFVAPRKKRIAICRRGGTPTLRNVLSSIYRRMSCATDVPFASITQ